MKASIIFKIWTALKYYQKLPNHNSKWYNALHKIIIIIATELKSYKRTLKKRWKYRTTSTVNNRAYFNNVKIFNTKWIVPYLINFKINLIFSSSHVISKTPANYTIRSKFTDKSLWQKGAFFYWNVNQFKPHELLIFIWIYPT